MRFVAFIFALEDFVATQNEKRVVSLCTFTLVHSSEYERFKGVKFEFY
jgi:hypothetical protein